MYAADGSAVAYGEGEPVAVEQESSPWVVGYTEEGYPYWFNTVTGESSWTIPVVQGVPDVVERTKAVGGS